MHVRSLVAAAAILALCVRLAAARDLTVVARGTDAAGDPSSVFIRPFITATGIAAQSRAGMAASMRCARQVEGAGQWLGPGQGG